MNLHTLLAEKNISMYRLSKTSGIPKTTIIDICSGKSDIRKCSALTVYKIAKTIGCSMEDLIEAVSFDLDQGSWIPKDKEYLEKGLPPFLQHSIEAMERSWKIKDAGGTDYHWDIVWCDLNADINYAEVEQLITRNQAWHLRKKYLRMVE